MWARLSLILIVIAPLVSVSCVSKDDGSSALPSPQDAAVVPPADATPPPPPPDPTYNHYWILGQNPMETNIYLYARNGATVTFDGTIDTPAAITLPADQFSEFNAGALGYDQTGSEWFFLELFSDQDVLVSFDRSVEIQTGETTFETQHGDAIHNKPPRELSTKLYFPLGGSGANDDILTAYAHQPTTMTVKAITNTGTEYTRTETFQGLFTSTTISTWLSGVSAGYTLEVEADHPIAVALFDELPRYPNLYNGSGYYFGGAGQSELHTEYLQIRQTYDRYATIYMPSVTDVVFQDRLGQQVGDAFAFEAQASTFVRDSEIGFDPAAHPLPYVVKLNGSVPFAHRSMTPTATDVRDSAAFMGWNTSLANLEIYSELANTVRIYDGRTQTLLETWNLSANEARVQNVAELGFPADQPFLALVVADEPIYQQIQNSRYLRQYPGNLGPVID